ncbi:FidL-like protein [Providencia rettgeri]|uniref:FidL-like protein n=1 Tax=Providencia rettgeri TaxID=587 RepID=UPI0034E0BF34
MKKYILVSIAIIATASISSILINKKENDIKICHSEVVWIKDNSTPEGLVLESKLNVMLSDENSGRINIYGNIKDRDKAYRVDRAIYFSYQPIDRKNNYLLSFKSSSVTISDNTPNELFSNFIQLEKDKIKYYVNVTKMNDNIYILKDEAFSSFTCHLD